MAGATVHYEGLIISREEAAARGETRYFTGKACRRGHIAQRRLSGACCQCTLDDYAANPQKYRDRKARAYAANPEIHRERHRLWLASRPNYDRDRYQSNGSIAAAKVRARRREMQRARAGREKPAICDLCRRGGQICFDHSHQTGAFRGWLCNRCNKALGFANDDPKLLRRMARYLEERAGLGKNGSASAVRLIP